MTSRQASSSWPRNAGLALAAVLFFSGCTTVRFSTAPARAPECWIDLTRGEEAEHADVMADLAKADVVYMGEAHTIRRHHELQLRLLQELFALGRPLTLCLEQLEARDQPAVDRYARGEIGFAALAAEIEWEKKWRNYRDYEALCEFARAHRLPIRALNAPAAVIRAVSRGGGLAKLPAGDRTLLPAEVHVDDPAYERLMQLELAVHMAVDPAKLRPMFEAQASRDEAMAANIVTALRPADGTKRVAFVVVGAGHVRYGLGTAERVRRRLPEVTERIVLITESGELVLSAAEKAASREVTISHADLRALGRPPGDYVRVLPKVPLPPGHPPVAR
ncbi:MAG: ChaN family lipoprotein [Opitutaceae bacterium]